MYKVPQFNSYVGNEEYEMIKSCFERNWITEGELSKKFVDNILELCGAKFGVLAPNGTLAIYLALIAAGIKSGDEVLVPDFTFIATANAVIMAGATPVFVDVKADCHIDLEDAARKITSKTRGILPVHIYGMACNMESVCDFASANDLIVVEDAAQGISVHWNNKHVGTYGATGTFSFFADKTITTGEGGMIVTNDEDIYKKLLFLRNQGRLNRGSFIHPEIGYNFRITDIQAAIGLAQLEKLEFIKNRKLEIYKRYSKNLEDLNCSIIHPDQKSSFVPFRVALRLNENSTRVMNEMKKNGIETRTFFYPLHMQPCFKEILKGNENIIKSTMLYDTGICLPAFVSITDAQIDYVCEVLQKYV